MNKITIVGLNGSPHIAGTTANLLKKFLKSCEKSGANAKLLNLVEYNIKPCVGCYSKNPKLCKYPCNQKDDMQKIYPILFEADALIFGTPVYWFNMSGLMKNFVDRLCCLATEGYLLEGKVGVSLSASKENEGGRFNASLSIASALNHLGLLIPPYSIMFYPGKEKVVKKGKAVWDKWILSEEKKIAKNLINLCSFLKKEKFKW